MVSNSNTEGKFNVSLLSLKPRQVLLSQRSRPFNSTNLSETPVKRDITMAGGELAETTALSLIQKVALVRSVAQYLKCNGFVKTYKKFRSEAEFKEEASEDIVFDLESIYKFFADSARKNDKVECKQDGVEIKTFENVSYDEVEKYGKKEKKVGKRKHEKNSMKSDDLLNPQAEIETGNVKKEDRKRSNKTEENGVVNEESVDLSEIDKIKLKTEALNCAVRKDSLVQPEKKKKEKKKKLQNVVVSKDTTAPLENRKTEKEFFFENLVNEDEIASSVINERQKENEVSNVIVPLEKNKKEKKKKVKECAASKVAMVLPVVNKNDEEKHVVSEAPSENNKKEKNKNAQNGVVYKDITAPPENDKKENYQTGFGNENVKENGIKSLSNGGDEEHENKASKKRKRDSCPVKAEGNETVNELDENPKKKTVKLESVSANRFKRVNADEIAFSNEKLKDNSYWAKDGAEIGYGAKAQEVLGQVKGRGFRHEKTKKKRGSYRGGQIDNQSYSVKFNYSDDE